MTADSPRLRLGIVGIIALSLFASLFARLYFLQVLAGPEYKVAAETNRIRVVTEPAPRGRILDRNGVVLVDNRDMVVVTVDRKVLGDLDDDERDDVVARLSEVVHVPVEEIEKRLRDQRFSPFSPVPVAQEVPAETFIYLREHAREFPSVDVRTVPVRTYPNGPFAAHVLGYVGKINPEEYEQRKDQGYELGDQIGKAGVERLHEDDLRGQQGEVQLEVDAFGRVLGEVRRRRPVQGHDVRLTIDLEVQRIAEQALAEGLEAARRRRFIDDRTTLRARAGSVTVLDTVTGGVVAMASYPSYDPAEFVNGISSQRYAELTNPEAGTPFNNWAIQGQFAPGSTFKLVTGAAAMVRGLRAPSSTINDQGAYTISECSGRCTFRNAGSQRHGVVDATRAMTVSSDVYYYAIGNDFWSRRGEYGETPIQDMAAQFGFGQRTGIPLPSEASGRIQTPERYRQEAEARDPDAFPKVDWRVGENIQLAIGQGETLATPLQIANAYTTFANGGTRFVPQITAGVQTQDGEAVHTVEPQVAGRVELAPDIRSALLNGFRGVTTDPRGTAYHAFAGWPHAQIPVAGKTGTAQVGGKQDTALFAAFAPADNPRYTVTVVMEEAGFGSTAAAPVARKVLEQLFGVGEPEAPPPVVTGTLD